MNTKAYRTAFLEYLRRGTPIRLATKEGHPTTQYVWRSLRDGKVRSSHQENDGRIFAWENPPATGHPGEDNNCRCEAVPYIPGETEFAYHEFSTSLASSADRWTDQDFVWHFHNGKGRAVTLLEIGHLREIAEQYAYNDGAEGAFRRLSDQIASVARAQGAGAFTYDFVFVYDFGSVEFSHGDGTVGGLFLGVAEDRGAIYAIRADSTFWFSDVFTDPLDIGWEAGGTAYAITGGWTAQFEAEVFKDKARSDFYPRD